MIPDYHVHTYFSADSNALPKEHIKKAVSLGMKEICFTDHVDYDYPENGENLIFDFDPDSYFSELSALREQYAGQIDVRIGVEMGLNPENDEACTKLSSNHPFDFIIGSSHIINGGDPYYPRFWEGCSPSGRIREYYESVLLNVKRYDGYDVYGHLDYIRRYIPDRDFVYTDKDYRDITDEILREIITRGHGIELNTSGLAKKAADFAPTISLLQRYRQLGGETVTVGSDAHCPENTGRGFSSARDILLNAGFRYVTSFRQRKAVQIPL